MAFLRVDTVELFPELRQALGALLSRLDEHDWDRATRCETWTVRDIAAHLIGVDLANVTVRRDRRIIPFPPGGLAEFNEQWVAASRRLSTRLLIDLGEIGGRWLEDWLATVDLNEIGNAPLWAGGGPAPCWLDVAREYTERWVHQQQIRAAVGAPGLAEERLVGPVIATFVHALPVALDRIQAPSGTTAAFRVTGPGGGTWHLVRESDRWDLRPGDCDAAMATLTTDVEAAWRRMTNDRTPPPPAIEGDNAIGAALAGAIAIMT